MNKKELRYSFNQIIIAACSRRCEDLHHTKKQQHEPDVVCPVEYAIEKHAFNIREHMRVAGL